MSYVNMDHAGWVESQIAASKKAKLTKKAQRLAAEHKGWFAAPDKLNPFQRRAFDILGIVGSGIYNAPIAWNSVIWAPRFIVLQWYGSLATWDFSQLTWFTLLCHQSRIRGCIAPGAPRHLEIALHERSHEGGMATRHPSLDEALGSFRAAVTVIHPITYTAPLPANIAAE